MENKTRKDALQSVNCCYLWGVELWGEGNLLHHASLQFGEYLQCHVLFQ